MSNLISVILPVYKPQEKFLTLAIQSILEQSYTNFELIIIEDKSELTNEQLIKNFNDQRIKYFLNQERTGFVNQLNQGIKLANGEFLARMDADDYSSKDRFQKQLDFLLSHQEIAVLGCNLLIINEKGETLGQRHYPTDSTSISHYLSFKNVLAHPAIFIRKNALTQTGGYLEEFNMLSDYDLWCRLSLAGFKFYNLQEPLLKYRLHTGASKNYHLKIQLKDTLKIKEKYFRFKNNWSLLAEIRYQLEKILLLLPSRFIYWLFIKLTIH